MTSTADVMSFIVEHRAKDLRPAVIADIFDRLLWIVDDNGTDIMRVRLDWLTGDDFHKAEIAMLMDEAYPCSSGDELKSVLAIVGAKWPALQGACTAMLEQWEKQFPGR